MQGWSCKAAILWSTLMFGAAHLHLLVELLLHEGLDIQAAVMAVSLRLCCHLLPPPPPPLTHLSPLVPFLSFPPPPLPPSILAPSISLWSQIFPHPRPVHSFLVLQDGSCIAQLQITGSLLNHHVKRGVSGAQGAGRHQCLAGLMFSGPCPIHTGILQTFRVHHKSSP